MVGKAEAKAESESLDWLLSAFRFPLSPSSPPATAAGSFHSHPIAGLDSERHFARKPSSASIAGELVAAGLRRSTARGAEGRKDAALGQQRELRRTQELELADDTVAAAMDAATARARAQRVAYHTHRKLCFERFNRRIHRVRHVCVYG
jgi:hypothetical protein